MLDLDDLDGSTGFAMYGVHRLGLAGHSVAGAGDVNGDGVSDLLVGELTFDVDPPFPPGYAYVVFGGPAAGNGGLIDLEALDGTNGFVIPGLYPLGALGHHVAGAGAFDGDGVADFLVAARYGDPLGRTSAGESYVVYGSKGIGSTGSFDLRSLDGDNGFAVAGMFPGGASGDPSDVSDFNDDGWPDLIIGADGADPHGSLTGQVYVVFAGPGVGAGGRFDLRDLSGANGFVINGRHGDARTAECASLGDFNGDGVDDIAIGAYQAASPGGIYQAGQVYVVYGDPEWFEPVLELGDLNGANGFMISGLRQSQWLGVRIGGSGDINDDGYMDLIFADEPRYSSDLTQSVYVLFGGPAVAPTGQFDLATLDGTNGFRVSYRYEGFRPGVRGIGDLNGDGIADFAIGNLFNLQVSLDTHVAVIFGASDIGQGGVLDPYSLNGNNGFIIMGYDSAETGNSVAAAGDVNDDGVGDLVLGEPYATPPGRPSRAGKAYVVFGRDTGDPADFDDDGDVDLVDFITFQLCFVGSNNPRAPGCARPDLDGDGDVDLADFLIFQQHFTGSR